MTMQNIKLLFIDKKWTAFIWYLFNKYFHI